MSLNSTTNYVVGIVIGLAAACGPATTQPPTTQPGPDGPPPDPSVLERAARADSVRQFYNQADVEFMIGMIHHHAQALVMARMAPGHGASPQLRTLAARIINGQKDEIALMQRWLRERGEPVPVVADDGSVEMPAVDGAGTDHAAHVGHAADDRGDPEEMMAGMLTPEQMARLAAARGEEWDRLFLTYMIQHHQGALVMVDALFATPGAGQGDAIFKIAADIGADQASEIDRMQRMLEALLFQI